MSFKFSFLTFFQYIIRCGLCFALDWLIVATWLWKPILRFFGVAVGVVIGRCLLFFLWSTLSCILIYIYKRKDYDRHSDYKSLIGKEPYDRKMDIIFILRDGNTWGEFLMLSVITLFIYVSFVRFVWILLNIPLFLAFLVFGTARVHQKWASERSFHHPAEAITETDNDVAKND